MASYPYYSPPPPPSPPCNDTTPTLPPPPPPPPPPPACNHTTTPTLSPLQSPPPPAQSHYSHPPPSLSPASPTLPPPPPPPPPSSYSSPPFSPAPPKSPQPPSLPPPSPPPPPSSSYPYYSPPPPLSPCNTTTPTLQPPPPPPTACACNKTTPTLSPPTSPSPSPPPPPPSSYYFPPLASLSPPPPASPPPPPSTRYSPPLHSPPSQACNETTPTLPPPPPPPPPPCNTTSPTVSPPTFPSLSPPPPQHLPPPPSPPPPSPLSPPPHSFSPPPPPPPSIAPPTYPPHKLPPTSPPLFSPSPPPPSVPPPCHCVCPSPWAPPPNYYPSIAPNYNPSIAPSPQFLSPSNGPHTVVLTTFVSLGGVFFLAFITIGLLSMAIKKRMTSIPTTGQPDNYSHGEGQGQVHTFESIPASTSAAHSVINIDPDQKLVPPDQGVGHVVKEGEILQQAMSTEPLSNQSVPDKISADPDVEQQTFEEVKDDPNKRLARPKPLSSVTDSTQGMDQESIGDDPEKVDDSNKKLGKPPGDQNVPDNMDAPPDAEHEPNDDEEKSDERNRKPLGNQGGPDNTTQDVEQESNAVEDESNDSKRKFPARRRKKNRSNGHKGKKGEKKSFKLGQAMKAATKFDPDGSEQESEDDDDGDDDEEVQDSPQDEEHESNADEEKSDERNHKPFGDPSVTDNADIDQDVDQESSAVEGKSNDSRKNLHPHMKNPSSGRKGKKGGKKSSIVGQAMKAAISVDQYGELKSQDDDNDEGEVQDRDTPQHVDHESNANEEESDERNRRPQIDQTETDNLDAAQDVEQEPSAIVEESNYSKERLRPCQKNPSSGRKGNQGERKPSKVGQSVKSMVSVNLDGEMQPQDDDVDDDDNEKVYNAPQDTELESNENEEEPDELNRKPLGNQSATDNSTQDAEQESNAVEDESKKKLRSHKKNPSNSRKGTQGETKPSKLRGQAMKAAFTFDPDGEQESQVDDNDEEELQDSPQDAEHESNADEESNERNRRPLKNQTEIDNIEAAQDVEQVSYAVEEESNDSTTRLRPLKKTSNARKGKQGEKQFSKLGQAGKAVISFYPDGEQEYQDDESDEAEAQEVPQDAEDESNANEEKSDERNRKPFSDQSVTDVADIAQDVDQESSAVEKESTNSKERLGPHKKSPSGLKGKQGERKSSKLGQLVKAAVNVDLDGAVQPQDYDNDEAEEEQSYRGREELSNLGQIVTVTGGDNSGKELQSFGNLDDKEEESEAYSSNQDLHRHKRHTSTQGRKESSNLGIKFSATIGADPGVVLKSLADDDEKAKKPEFYGSDKDSPRNIFIGAQNLDQIVTATFGHDPSMECKSLISDGDKEESKSFGSNKDSRLHTRQISVRRRKESLNVGQILTAPIGGNPGMYLKSHADDDEKEENDDLVDECDDPSMEPESFVDDNAKKEESKSFGSKKVLHLHKRQIGAQRKEEAPHIGQILTAQFGGDEGVDLKSLADDYEKEENEDPSMECDDPNMECELLVDDDANEEKSDSFGSKKYSRLHKRQIGARGRRDPRNVGQIWSDSLGPSTYFKSLADDDEKEEKEDQGMECDDPSMEFESIVDDGAKEEESESFGLKKVTRLQKHQIGGRGRKGPSNVGQILNIPTGGDAGVDLEFLAVEQKKLELFGRKEVSRLNKRQTGAGGRKEPPNLGQILTATTSSDPGVGLKSVATQVWASNIGESMTVRNDDDPYGELESHDDDGEGDLSVTATKEGDPNAGLKFHEEDEELESECSNKGLGVHKPHALSLGETEPSTDDQSVFVTADDDPDESGKVARRGKPLARPRTTGVRGKRRT